MRPSPPINDRSNQRHSGRLSADSAHARISVRDSPPIARPISSRHAQIACSHRRTRPCLAENRSPQPLRSSLHRARARGKIPIAPAAPPLPTSRDFVPWRFSDAGRRSAWIASSSRRPKRLGGRTPLTREHLVRRLTAIFAADVAGYSRLTGMDEEGTHVRLKEHLRVLIDPKVAAYRGHIVKNTGDGFLAEFNSVVDALRCAVDVQRGMAERNSDVPPSNRIEFRIGINVGDIIEDNGDIFGDGVNVAARLEAIAEPGGICVSDDAHRQVRDKLDIVFDDAGEQNLKNIERPVRVFRVMDRVAAARQRPTLALPNKPSIAVLPFQNLSADPDQEYFADGVVEDITMALSRFHWLFVIARNSSFTYKGRAMDVKQVGRELGVRYVLEGSVRKAGNRMRIAGQLIDAETGAHLWADRFDGALEDMFDLQDHVTSSVVGAIAPKLQHAGNQAG